MSCVDVDPADHSEWADYDFGFDFESVNDCVAQSQTEPPIICPTAGIAKKFSKKNRRRNLKRQDYSNSLTLLKNGAKAPNMSRRVQRATLCAFPTFDKCDSLVFLPVSMVRLMNSADSEGLRELLSSHMNKQCVIDYKGVEMTLDLFIQMQEILNATCPDKMCCVHDTQVVNNTIHASLFSKFTENQLIYEAMAPLYERNFPIVFSTASRRERWLKKLHNSRVPDEQRPHITDLASLGADLVVYANAEWLITFDFDTRKVTRFDYRFYLVSVKDGRENHLGGLELLAKM